MSEEQTGTYSKSIQGGKWVFIATIIQKLLNIVTFFVLARLLAPEDYGAIAVLFIVIGFFSATTTPGFGKALLQRSGDIEAYLDSAWTFSLGKSIGVFLLIFFGAPFITEFFHVQEAAGIIRWSGILVVIGALANSREIYFFKRLDFQKIFWRDVISQIVYMGVAIGWALYIDASAWALFAGHVSRYIAGTVMSYVLYPHWQRMSFAFRKLKDLWWYSKWVVGQNIVGYILGIIDSAFVGRFLNPTSLGIYAKARDLVYAPVSPIMNIVSRVGFLAYARVQDKHAKIQEGFLKTFDIVLAFTLPLFLVLLAEGGLIVQVLLGSKWMAIIVPLKILSLGIIFSSLAAITRPVFDALGRPGINVKLDMLQLVTLVIGIIVGIHFFEVRGVAIAVVVSSSINLIYAILLARPILRLGFDTFWPTLGSVGFALCSVLILALPSYLFWFKEQENPWIIGGWLLVLGITYIIGIWQAGRFFKRGPKQTFLSIIHEMMSV